MKRTTKQREAILKYLAGNRSHPTADDIYEGVKKEVPQISIGTVYRNLRGIERDGLVAEISIEGRWEGMRKSGKITITSAGEKCGKVLDIDETFDETFGERIAPRTGLKIISPARVLRSL